MRTEVLSQDEFLHLTDIQMLLEELQQGADWSRAESIRQIAEEILKLKRVVITVEKQV